MFSLGCATTKKHPPGQKPKALEPQRFAEFVDLKLNSLGTPESEVPGRGDSAGK